MFKTALNNKPIPHIWKLSNIVHISKTNNDIDKVHLLVPTTTAYKWWNCQVLRPANCCQHILPNRFLNGFPDPSQFAASKLTHYSSKPQRPSDSSRSWQRILLSGDVHPNPGPTTKYPCPVCARNVTGRGVSYLCNRCSGWVHSKCSGLQNAAEYRRIKDWVCSSCNSPPTLPKLQPPPIPTQAVDENSFTIMQFNANGIGNKLTELSEFLKRHNVKVVVIQESKLSSNSKTPSIQNLTTVRKDRRQGQGGGLLTLIHKSINFSRKPESPETGRTSFGGVDHHGHAGRHGVDHYQRLHTPGKLLHRRLPPFPGSSDDDNGHPNTG